jgi:hypothetical protein
MYKIEIDISDWCTEEKITIETNDFEKVQIIQEFLEFQMENGWVSSGSVVPFLCGSMYVKVVRLIRSWHTYRMAGCCN